MKALLWKDAYVLVKQMRYLLLVLILFCTLPGLSATAFSSIYVMMLPISTLGYDSRCKWNQLAVMMPYTKNQLVISKYILGYIGTAIVMVFSNLSSLVAENIGWLPPGAPMMQTLALFPCIGLIMLSVNLPLIYRFGVEKGRALYIISVGTLGSFAALSSQSSGSLHFPESLFILLPLFTVICNLISIKLSISFFRPDL